MCTYVRVIIIELNRDNLFFWLEQIRNKLLKFGHVSIVLRSRLIPSWSGRIEEVRLSLGEEFEGGGDLAPAHAMVGLKTI